MAKLVTIQERLHRQPRSSNNPTHGKFEIRMPPKSTTTVKKSTSKASTKKANATLKNTEVDMRDLESAEAKLLEKVRSYQQEHPQEVKDIEWIGDGEVETEEKEKKKEFRMNVNTFASTNLPLEVLESKNTDQIAEEVLKLKELRLDRYGIKVIENLDVLTQLKSLYLQHNSIEVLEGLDFLPHLSFLCLAHNRIKKIEEINHLPHLILLDLRHNCIEAVDVEELPKSLSFLYLEGNPVVHADPSLRQKLIHALPTLRHIDDVAITDEEWEEFGPSDDEEEPDESDEDEDDLAGEPTIIMSGAQDSKAAAEQAVERSRRRQKQMMEDIKRMDRKLADVRAAQENLIFSKKMRDQLLTQKQLQTMSLKESVTTVEDENRLNNADVPSTIPDLEASVE